MSGRHCGSVLAVSTSQQHAGTGLGSKLGLFMIGLKHEAHNLIVRLFVAFVWLL
jgi:hypothetical protein